MTHAGVRWHWSRRAVALLVAGAGLLGTVAAAPAAAARPGPATAYVGERFAPRSGDTTQAATTTRTFLAASPNVVYGGRTVLEGQVQALQGSTWAFLPGVYVRIDMRVAGSTSYQTLGYAKSDADGVFHASHAPLRGTDYRAFFAGGAGFGTTFAASSSSWRTTTVTPQLTAAVATRGLDFTASGLVRPRSNGQRIYLQRLVDGSYRTVSFAPVQSTTYSYNPYRLVGRAPARVGTYFYRVYYPPLGGRTAATREVFVRVFLA